MKSKNIPENWKEVELRELGELIMGQSPPGSSYNKSSEGLPLLNGAADFKGKKPVPLQFTTKPIKVAQKDDVLMCIRATIGNVTLSHREYCLGRGVAAFRVDKQKVDNKYLVIILENRLKQLVTQGSTIKGLRRNDLLNIKIPLPFTSDGKPDLEKQKKIVAILEKAEKLKQKREEAIKLADEYLKSVFYEMFGDPVRNGKKWDIKESKDCFQPKYGIPLDSNLFGDTGKPLIRIRDLVKNKVSLYTTEDLTKFKEVPIAKRGDLLIGMDGDFNLVKWNNVDVIINQRIVKIEPKNKIEKEYLRFVLPFFIKIIEKKKSFVTVKHLSDKDIKSLKIPLPPLSLQKKFAQIVEKVEKMKEEQKKSKEEIENLFNALMQKAFRGSW